MSHSSVVPPADSPSLQRLSAWVKNHSWLQQFLVAITSVSVSTKIMGIVMALTILLGLAVTIQVRFVMVNTLLGELDNRGFAVASDLAGRAAVFIKNHDLQALEQLLVDTLNNHHDTRYAFVLDAQGRVVTVAFQNGADVGELGSELTVENMTAIIATNASAPLLAPSHVHYESAEGQIHDFAMPVNGGEVGIVRLGLNETRVWGIISAVTERMLLTTLLVAGVGILAAILLTWLLTRPILDLVTTTEQLRQGDLSVRAPHWTDDEIGALSDAFNQMISELEVSQQLVVEKENARSHLLSRLISAQEEERKRIARELHDGVGQALTSILVHIKLLAQQQDAATQARMLELRRLVDETLVDVRMLSRELRPSALDDLGLAAALERYVVEFGVRFPELEIDLHCTLPQRLPANLETSLYRMIQEAMTNTARHSHATSLSVVVNQRAGAVHALIEDNGQGFDVESTRRAGSSVGLHSMSERSELLNGALEIESSSDGTTVYITIPLTGPLVEETSSRKKLEEDSSV